jgi:SAM-dependent methyltransferase
MSVSRKIAFSITTRGYLGTLRYVLARSLLRVVKVPSSNAEAFTLKEANESIEFDRRFNVDTAGIIPVHQLPIEYDNWLHGSAYIATSPFDLSSILAKCISDYSSHTFVDLGCGKGRVLLFASGLPFNKVVGVEFCVSLADTARRNLKSYTGPLQCKQSEVLTMDAVEFEFPDSPLVVFMYHPFDETIMQQVVSNLESSCKKHSRQVIVLYFKPEHRHCWDNAVFMQLVSEDPLYALYKAT